MSKPHLNVLIVVESRHGSTLGIAGEIAQRLVAHGLRASVADSSANVDADVDAVLVGSAIYMGKWLKPALRFLDDHALELAKRPVWLFSSGPLADGTSDGNGLESGYVTVLTERANARGHRTFAGCLDQASLGPVESLVAHAVHAPRGDFRDWEEIRDWADEIAAAMHFELADGTAHPVRP